jgi:hypothetical protein
LHQSPQHGRAGQAYIAKFPEIPDATPGG